MAGGNRSDGGGEWTREPPDRTASDAARGHRGADPVGSGAERQRYRAAPIGGSSARRSRSAASPNEGGTAEGTTFRPGTKRSFLDSRAREPAEAHIDVDNRSAQPHRGEAPGRQRRHAAPARHPAGRPRDADRRVPAARRRSHAGLPPGVGRRRRAPRPLLVPGRRPAAPAGGPRRDRPDPDPSRDRGGLPPGAPDRGGARRRPARRDPGVRPAPPRPADRGDAAVHRRRGRRPRLRRGQHLRADGAAAGS